MSEVVLFRPGQRIAPNQEADAALKIIRQLVEMLTDAEELGYRRAMADANVDPLHANNCILLHELQHEVRASLYVAQVRRALTRPVT